MLITGTMGNYLKTLGLKQKWQEKKTDQHLTAGPKVVSKPSGQKSDVYTAAIDSFMKEQEEFRSKINSLLRENSECSRASVEFKLQYGGKLSSRELEYIRNNCPDLYSKAMEREQEREAYANRLRNCTSTDEVFMARLGKLSSLMGDVKSAEARGDYGASFELRARLYNIEEEHNEFIKSEEYQELCRKEKAEKEAAEAEAREKKATEAEIQEEDVAQAEDTIPPDGKEPRTSETAPNTDQEQPGTNPDLAKDKSTPDAVKHNRPAPKDRDAHMAENKVKSAADKYQKTKPTGAKENFDVNMKSPINSGPDIPENATPELGGVHTGWNA